MPLIPAAGPNPMPGLSQWIETLQNSGLPFGLATSSRRKFVDMIFEKIDWHKADVIDIPSLEVAFPEVTHVYHVAALISFDPKQKNL